MNFLRMLKMPNAYLPVAMSLIAFGLLVFHISMFGVAREADEGAGAHVFQLLMAAQLPIVLLFAVRFLPKEPMKSVAVMGLQLSAALMALTPVWWFHL